MNLSGRGDKDVDTAGEVVRAARRADAVVSDGAIASVFETARAEGRAALVGYLPAGLPDRRRLASEMLSAMVEGGCDLVEVGVPYSDPVMDGPTIQAAADTALRGGVRLRDVFARRRAGRPRPAAGPSS